MKEMIKPYWRIIAYISTVIFAILFLWIGNTYASRDVVLLDGRESNEVVRAKVTAIWARDAQPLSIVDASLETVTVYFEAEITNGPRKGKLVGAEQINDPFSPVAFKEVEVGDKITLITFPRSETETVWIWQEYLRLGPLAALGGVFVGLLLVFSGRKGVSTLLSLVFTCMAVFLVFVPLILSGHNIYLSTILVCVYTLLVTLALVHGFNMKSLSAGIGCLGGLLACGVIVRIMDRALNLTGLVNEEAAFLLYINPDNPLDLKAIIFSGIMIGAMGAIMDVAVSMASAICELYEANPDLGFKGMVRSGFNIGQDMIGTMTNTLILAYMGGSMSLILLLIVYANSITELLNRELIVVEILQAVSGSIGLLLAAPLTAVVASYVFSHLKNKGKKVE